MHIVVGSTLANVLFICTKGIATRCSRSNIAANPPPKRRSPGRTFVSVDRSLDGTEATIGAMRSRSRPTRRRECWWLSHRRYTTMKVTPGELNVLRPFRYIANVSTDANSFKFLYKHLGPLCLANQQPTRTFHEADQFKMMQAGCSS